MRVCMRAFVHVCVCVCVCDCVCVRACMHVCVCARARVFSCVCVCVFVFVIRCVHLWVRGCMWRVCAHCAAYHVRSNCASIFHNWLNEAKRNPSGRPKLPDHPLAALVCYEYSEYPHSV